MLLTSVYTINSVEEILLPPDRVLDLSCLDRIVKIPSR